MTSEDVGQGACREPARLAAVRRAAILDTPPEPSFDRLTRLASRILRAPVGLVSLIDEDRQFFKSSHGLPEPWASCRQTPLVDSFCRHVVARGRPLVVEDARHHPLVCDHSAVIELDVVAYLGVPLATRDGHILGAFCVIDERPRSWTDDDLETLVALAQSVMTEIALREDAAERERVEQAVREGEERLRLLLEHSGQGIYGLDPQGRCTFVNRSAARLLGRRPEEIIGQDMHAVVRHARPDGTPCGEVHCPLSRVPWQGRECPVATETFRRADGSAFPVEYSAHPIILGGEIVGAVVTFDDITERKRMEEVLALQEGAQRIREVISDRRRIEDVLALREGAQRIREVIQGVRDAFVLVDLDDRIIEWNHQAEAAFGFSPAGAEGLRFAEAVFPLRDREDVYRGLIREFRASGASPRLEGRHEVTAVDRRGREFPAEMTITPIRRGEAHLFGVFLHDITERKRAAEVRAQLMQRLITSQEDERRRIARDLHDGIGQSLTSLMFGLAAAEGSAGLEQTRGMIRDLRRAAASAVAEVRHLAQGLRPAVLDHLGFAAALEQLARDFRSTHDVQVVLPTGREAAVRLPSIVETALYRIVQEAFTNIARHAHARVVRVVVERDPDAVRVTVRDDGCGFDPDVVWRLGAIGKHMGLCGMRERAALLHGEVQVESRPGAGTTVRVQITLGGEGR